MRNVHVSFFTLRTCVVCVMGVTPLNSFINQKRLFIPMLFQSGCKQSAMK